MIYFVRNGNLYRRVFLVAPDRADAIKAGYSIWKANNGFYLTSIFGGQLKASWQGMNDISCRPGGFNSGGVAQAPIPNDLGDLTNRENRAFRPRFLNDFTSNANPGTPDGIPDDSNADGINDYYPTLYYDGQGYSPDGNPINFAPNQFVNENVFSLSYTAALRRVEPGTLKSWDVYAFPFIYPGMYSVPDPNRVTSPIIGGLNLGWVHYVPPNMTSGYLNHSPLDLGETLNFAPGGKQTWFGFPTWRETMAGIDSPSGKGWTDPIAFVSGNNNLQPLGLNLFNPKVAPSLASPTFPTPVATYGTNSPPYGYDGAGSTSFVAAYGGSTPAHLWEDDLILTNVRSFDVKAYDPFAPLYNASVGTALSAGYWDLGYAGLSPATYAPNFGTNSTVYGPSGGNGIAGTGQFSTPFQSINGEPQGFGHEGRIPPMLGDFRLDPRRPFLQNLNTGRLIANNIGDNQLGVIRLTHTFDTWSTDYTNAPDTDILLSQNPGNVLPPNNAPITSKSIYPAFPPPYPSPLRGIQIQIRVTDPRNERTKVLTIRHDFTDKL